MHLTFAILYKALLDEVSAQRRASARHSGPERRNAGRGYDKWDRR